MTQHDKNARLEAESRKETDRLRIKPVKLRWLYEVGAETDLCAHGGVVVRREDAIFVDDGDENWNLSAAALFLLRTIHQDHTPDRPVAEHLFPCCGHAMFAQEDSPDVAVIGCPHGRDWSVTHNPRTVVLGFTEGPEVELPWGEWRDAVIEFADAIERFYVQSPEKAPVGEDLEGYTAFRAEWRRRRVEATTRRRTTGSSGRPGIET